MSDSANNHENYSIYNESERFEIVKEASPGDKITLHTDNQMGYKQWTVQSDGKLKETDNYEKQEKRMLEYDSEESTSSRKKSRKKPRKNSQSKGGKTKNKKQKKHKRKTITRRKK